MKDVLKSKGISITPFRIAVLEVFYKYNNAISLSVLSKELKESNRITLYRTLKIYKEKGIIHEIAMGSDEVRYAICSGCATQNHQHQHVHFKCDSCDIVYCLEIETFPVIKAEGFMFNELEIQSTGVCKECSIG